MDKLEKFIHLVHEMRKIIEKNIEIKFKDDMTKIQFEINKKIEQSDLTNQIQNFATIEQLKNADVDLETYD